MRAAQAGTAPKLRTFAIRSVTVGVWFWGVLFWGVLQWQRMVHLSRMVYIHTAASTTTTVLLVWNRSAVPSGTGLLYEYLELPPDYTDEILANDNDVYCSSNCFVRYVASTYLQRRNS